MLLYQLDHLVLKLSSVHQQKSHYGLLNILRYLYLLFRIIVYRNNIMQIGIISPIFILYLLLWACTLLCSWNMWFHNIIHLFSSFNMVSETGWGNHKIVITQCTHAPRPSPEHALTCAHTCEKASVPSPFRQCVVAQFSAIFLAQWSVLGGLNASVPRPIWALLLPTHYAHILFGAVLLFSLIQRYQQCLLIKLNKYRKG